MKKAFSMYNDDDWELAQGKTDEEVIQEALEYAKDVLDEDEPPSEVMIGDAVEVKASDYFRADWLVEAIGENAYSDIGEAAEDYPGITEEEEKELEKLVCDFIDSRCKNPPYKIENVKIYNIDGEGNIIS